MQDPKLWERISACHPDDIDADLPFSRRLARENSWSATFARRVIVEYQRFAYLSQLGRGMVTPSDEVDQAWHLHLTYTRHYWGPFKQALGNALHHMPTKGGQQQALHFLATYEKTLAIYREEFGEPPQDIWPCASIRFGRAPHFKRINAQDVWMVPKPRVPSAVSLAWTWIGNLPPKVRALGLMAFCLLAGGGGALAHGSPAGDTWIERFRSMVFHWATEHSFEFTLGVMAMAIVLIVLLKKATGGSGCTSGGCGGGDSGGGSGCGGCGGGD